MTSNTTFFFIGLNLFSFYAFATQQANAIDPYEKINRNIYHFNQAVDATMLKLPARLYKQVVPAPVRAAINNAYNNANLLPTLANDILQADWNHSIKDTWRFIINSTYGLAGFFDVASNIGLPPHTNDLGLTFAKWGNTQSPFIMIPLIGPSTLRDGFGLLFDYALFSPYRYLPSDALIYGLIGLRYVDLRSQLFETEHLIDEAMDSYSFIRDAYLQHRHFLMNGESLEAHESLYMEDDEFGLD